MLPAGNGAFIGAVCPKNTYGAAAKVNGLQLVPCKPCPRNMVTKNEASTSPKECYNPGGWRGCTLVAAVLFSAAC